ncbi:MAG TPA: tripartite tricarboxylate transporter permease, partial [Hyphomicrobiales bacterium]|nr:tripartite tricarboxylate transporter permease [Hyphomicrobiales bacterium]
LGTFGTERVTGIPRFWLEFEYLLDGFRLIPIALGLFAIPEIITMMSTGRSISALEGREGDEISWRQVAEGIGSVFRHGWLFLRSSFIGVFVGIIPGVGGETAPFVAYASAQQISKHPETFGKGAIEGVIAPESGNNAKEGGALVPTLAFGIPGSSGMALLLGGFLILGLEPGPEFLKNHLDLAFGLAMVVAVSNRLAAAAMIAVAPKISLVTRVEGHVLGPILLVLVILGAYSTSNNAIDVLFVFVFGLLGYFMQGFGFSRAALLLGFVLGGAAETYLHISLNAYGNWFFLRPISMALALMVVAAIVWPLIRKLRGGNSG